MSRESVEIVYRVKTPAASLAERTEALLLEQTVELPRAALPTAFVRDEIVGRVVATAPVAENEFLVTLAQPVAATALDPAQFLNVLFGNSSLQPDVELADLRIPPSLARAFGGPRFGLAGLRAVTGVHGRALTASALKPMGLSVAETAALCRLFAAAGLDVVKDDHGLADHAFCPFADRVRACVAATAGTATLYVPNLIGPPATVLRQAALARDLGARAVMISPMLLGLPFLRELAAELGLPILAHPSFGGAQRIAPATLLGKLFPLFGADAVIYPNAGGRFAYDRDTCAALARALRSPGAALAPALPVPAGGLKTENVPAVLEFYGPDTMLLIGGSLLASPDPATLLARSRAFATAVRTHPPATPLTTPPLP